MSMIYTIRQASEATMDRLHSNPSLVRDFFAYQKAPARQGLLYRLFGRTASSAAVGPLFPDDVDEYSLEKSWHGLHYLLTGSAWEGESPAAFLLNGGREIGDVDLGYGPAISFTRPETTEIAATLSTIDDDYLRARFNPNAMQELEIYPNFWLNRNAEDELAELLAAYSDLREFVAKTDRQGLGMVAYIG